MDQVNEEAITNGWIHAGSYYFQIASRGASAGVNINISSQEYDADNLKEQLGSTLSKKIVDIIAGPGGRYQKAALSTIVTLDVGDRAGGQMTISIPSANKGPVQNILDKVFGSLFVDLAASIGKMITTNAGDPVISMATFGGNLATTIELLFWSALIAIFFAWLATSPMSCVQPLGHTMNFVLMIALPIISLCIMLLWAAGITMALYVPLIPYLVFTFSALSWVVLVIEAMLGAPLIALTLIVPSEDEIGKAGHAIIILLGLFLRPALMILGFILATKFLIVAIGMLNFSFAATLKASISMGFGIFGFIALILVYTGLAVALVHEAFSLIYLLPDKTLRWMGGSPESTDVGQQVKGLEASVDKGTGIGKGMMKGGLAKAQGMMSKGGGAAGGVGLK
jgi:conjugal transfer/type IV secretion protein DotA/TraY